MKNVMIVEDDKKVALAIATRLKSMGYTVVCAEDAVYAMNHAVKFNPDVVLMDINLPGGSGFTVAQRMQSAVQTISTPIIFMTASKEVGLRAEAQSAGGAAFLEKPFTLSALQDALECCH